MKVLKSYVDWRGGMARMNILVDQVPVGDVLQYARRDCIYFAKHDGFISYFAWPGKGNDSDISGVESDIALKDGSKITVKSPWSGNPEIVEKAGFEAPVDVCITDNEYDFNRQGANRTGAIALELAREIALGMEGVTLERDPHFGSYRPTRDNEDDSPYTLGKDTELPERLKCPELG